MENRRLRYETDSQTAYYSVMAMKGNVATFPIVKELRLICSQHDVELEVVWRPREDANQQIADYWSKVEDNSAWVLHPLAYGMLISHPVLQGRCPTIDVFASSDTTKVAGSYYSKYLDLDTKGVDAFVQPWAWCACADSGMRHLAYINGPFHRMGEIVRKIQEERVDCVLVGPQWPRYWMAMLQKLPVREKVTLPHWQDLCQPSRYVQQQKRRNGHPKYHIVAWYILWWTER